MNATTAAYLGSHFLSLLGNGIAAIALPLAVLQITGSPLGMGVVSAATAVPAVLVGLLAGVVLDRWNRRDLSVASDLVSAAAIATLPVVDVSLGLDLGWFVVLGILAAVGDVPGMTAREVLVAPVAAQTGIALERLVGIRQALTSAALVVGPALAGTLVALLGSTAVFYVTAGTSAAAALLTLAVPRAAGSVRGLAAAPETPWQQLTGGVAVLRRSRFLVGTVVLIVGLAAVVGGLQGLVLPLHFTTIDRPEMLGLALTVLSLGMLAGALAFTVVGRRLSRRVWLGAGLAALTAGFAGISTLASLPVIFAAAAVVGLGNAALGGVIGVLQIERTPDRARGRVLALQNTALQLAAPLGIAGAGVVAEAATPVAAGFSVTAVWVLALVVLLAIGSFRGLGRDGTGARP